MLRGLYTAAFGMINSQYKQDVTANNIANSQTNGYKQDKAVTEPFPEVIIQNKDKTVFGKPQAQYLGAMPLGVEQGEIYTDFTQGPLEDTGDDHNLAISGRGFFQVGFPDGVKYTRDGSFSIDSDGRIVNSDGGYLLARDINTGSLGPINAGDGKVQVQNDGRVLIDSQERYRIELSDFNDYNAAYKSGKNMYITDPNNVTAANNYRIDQGKLERSNIDIGAEMVNMMTNLRSYQANQRVMQLIDETLSKAVNEVGALK
jgi:fagellar hook-basal body proteins